MNALEISGGRNKCDYAHRALARKNPCDFARGGMHRVASRFVILVAALALTACDRHKTSPSTQRDDDPPRAGEPSGADDEVIAKSMSNETLLLQDLQVLQRRAHAKEVAEERDRKGRWEAASLGYKRLATKRGSGIPDDVRIFAPVEWKEFTNAFHTISAQSDSNAFVNAVTSAQYAYDHSVMAAKERAQLWAGVKEARADTDLAMADLRQQREFTQASADVQLLEQEYSNIISTLRPSDANELQVSALAEMAQGAIKLSTMLKQLSARLSQLREQREYAIGLDVKTYAPSESSEFDAAFECIPAQKNLVDLSSAIRLAQDRLSNMVSLSQQRKLVWLQIAQEREEAARVFALLRTHPMTAHASVDLAILNDQYEQLLARSMPKDAALEQAGAFVKETKKAKEILAQMDACGERTGYLAEWRTDFIGDLPFLRQISPDRVKESERLIVEIENAKDLTSYASKVDRAIVVMKAALDDADSARRRKP